MQPEPQPGEALWVHENVPSRRFPVYTRGNAGEVFPNVVSPLTASVFDEAVRRAQLRSFVESGAFVPGEFTADDAPFTGFFGGYLYLNLSLGRVIGVRTPGLSPEVVDVQLFGTNDAPPYRPGPGDRSLRSSVAIVRNVRTLFTVSPLTAVEAQRRDVTAWLATLPDVAGSSDDDLIALVRTFPARLERDFYDLLQASNAAAAGRAFVERLLTRKGSRDHTALANRVTNGLGTIESASLPDRLWTLGRTVAGDDAVTACFDAGLDGLDARLRAEPAAAGFVAAFDRFLAEHGHRCTDEYELAVPSWAMQPHGALAAIDRLRLAPDDRAPRAARDRMEADRPAAEAEALALVRPGAKRLYRRALHTAREGAEARERSKDLFVRDLHGMRRVVDELMRRAQARGGPADRRDGYMVTAAELPAFVRDPQAFATTIAERAARRDYLQSRVPPFCFEGTIPHPSTWALRSGRAETTTAGGTLTGIGVCNGVATGPARVVLDPDDPRGIEPGDVLVAPITDPAWTPLFLAACAVVVDVGAQLSHAAIVARELGIPAVVSVANASRTIADGTMLRVDGGRGEVTILG